MPLLRLCVACPPPRQGRSPLRPDQLHPEDYVLVRPQERVPEHPALSARAFRPAPVPQAPLWESGRERRRPRDSIAPARWCVHPRRDRASPAPARRWRVRGSRSVPSVPACHHPRRPWASGRPLPHAPEPTSGRACQVVRRDRQSTGARPRAACADAHLIARGRENRERIPLPRHDRLFCRCPSCPRNSRRSRSPRV